MKIGIYTRNNHPPFTCNDIQPEILDGLKWMFLNNYDGYILYSEVVTDELTDISDRTELNKLIHDAENNLIDAVFVSNIKIFSPITIKALQAIIALQEVGMNVFHNNGHFDANDENVKIFKAQFEENWKMIYESTKDINLGGVDNG